MGLGERNRLPQILLLIHVASTRGLGAGHGGVPQKRYPGLPGLGGQREEKPPASAPTCWGPFALQDPIFSGQCFLRLLRSWGCTCGEGGQGQGRAEGIAPEASSPEPERTWEGQGRCHAPPPPTPRVVVRSTFKGRLKRKVLNNLTGSKKCDVLFPKGQLKKTGLFAGAFLVSHDPGPTSWGALCPRQLPPPRSVTSRPPSCLPVVMDSHGPISEGRPHPGATRWLHTRHPPLHSGWSQRPPCHSAQGVDPWAEGPSGVHFKMAQDMRGLDEIKRARLMAVEAGGPGCLCSLNLSMIKPFFKSETQANVQLAC